MAEERKLPLQGLKVVELGTHFAVPSVTRMLADWGAEVIKVENCLLYTSDAADE